MKNRSNLTLLPVPAAQRAIRDELYIPIAFRKTVSVTNDTSEVTEPLAETTLDIVENDSSKKETINAVQ